MFLLKGCIFFAIFVFSVKSQNSCTTPVREKGNCVPVKSCIIHLDILSRAQNAPLSQKELTYLQKSYCGLVNQTRLVCCADRHLVENQGNDNGNVIIRDPDEGPVITPNQGGNGNGNGNGNTNGGNGNQMPGGDTGVGVDNTINNNNNNNNEAFNDVSNHPNINLFPLNRCGRIDADKVSNGNISAPSEFPWMTLLEYQTSTGERKFQCGGSLINSRYVLTAAHCVTGISNTLISVRIGEYDTNTTDDCDNFQGEVSCAPPIQDIGIEEVIYHPNYDSRRFSNDIALIRLDREADLNDESVQSVCLPLTLQAQRADLKRMFIAGWGTTEKQVTSNLLIKALIPIVPNDACQRAYGRRVQMTAAQMCAGGENFVDSCGGDSGGPLFYPFSIKPSAYRHTQYGIVSAGGNACGGDGSQNFPGIYTRVSFYMKWILDSIKP